MRRDRKERRLDEARREKSSGVGGQGQAIEERREKKNEGRRKGEKRIDDRTEQDIGEKQ